MNKIKVKVFDAYEVLGKDEKYYTSMGVLDVFDYHNSIVNSKGMLKPNKDSSWKKLKPIKPMEKHLVEKYKYELDDMEKMVLKMLKDNTRQAKKFYDSCERKQSRFEHMLIQNIDIDKNIYDGDRWDCNLSPLGYCLYSDDEGEPTCIFCGEPEERK